MPPLLRHPTHGALRLIANRQNGRHRGSCLKLYAMINLNHRVLRRRMLNNMAQIGLSLTPCTARTDAKDIWISACNLDIESETRPV